MKKMTKRSGILLALALVACLALLFAVLGFVMPKNASVLADDDGTEDDGSGTTTTYDGTFLVEPGADRTVLGDMYFESISDVLEENEPGTYRIVMLDTDYVGIEDCVTIPSGYNIVLVPAGYTLSYSSEADDTDNPTNSTITVESGATLTLSGGGTIENDADGGTAITVMDGGTFVMQAGDLVGDTALYVASGADVTVTGGSMTATTCGLHVEAGVETISLSDTEITSEKDAIYLYGSTEITITDSTIYGTRYGIYLLTDEEVSGDITLSLTDTDVTGGHYGIARGQNDTTSDKTEINISGGSVSTDGSYDSTQFAAIYMSLNGGSLEITGAAITSSKGSDGYDGTYYGMMFWCYDEDNPTVVTLENSTLTADSEGLCVNGSTGRGYIDLTVEDTEITAGIMGIYFPAVGGTLTVSGTTSITAETGIEIRNGSLTISGDDVTITSTVTSDDNFSEGSNSNGTTVDGAAIAISTYDNAGISVTIEGGTFTGYYAVYEKYENGNAEDESATIEISIEGGTYDGIVSSESCTEFISGGTFTNGVIGDYLEAGLTVDGTSMTVASEDDYSILAVVYVENSLDSSATDKYVYGFNSLETAISTIGDGTYDLTLTGDLTETSSFTISADSVVTLDLNGYTLTDTCPDTFAVIVRGSLTLISDDDATFALAGTGYIGSVGTIVIGANVTVSSSTAREIISNQSSGSLTVYGTVSNTADDTDDKVYGIITILGTVSVESGAKVYGTTYGIYESAQLGDVAVVIKDGATVESDGYGIAVMSFTDAAYTATLTVEGGTITAKHAGIVTNGAGTGPTSITVNGGTITGTNGEGMYLPDKYQTVEINGGTISGSSTGIEIRQGSLTINDGTIVTTAEAETDQGNNSGSTVQGAALAISQYYDTEESQVTVTINGGTFIAKNEGCYALFEVFEDNANGDSLSSYVSEISIIDGTFDGAISSKNCTGFISGGVYYSSTDSDDYELSDNYVSESFTAVKAGNTYVVLSEDEAGSYAAVVGTTAYETLAGAIEAVAGTGKTVYLISNVTLTESITITSTIVIDLNGKTISGDISKLLDIEASGYKVTIKDSSEVVDAEGNITTAGTGAITSTSDYAVYVSGGTLVIDGGTYSADSYAVYVNNGYLTTNGGSFSGTTNGGAYFKGTTLTVNAGTFNGGKYGMYLQSAGSGAIINDGTFTGTVAGLYQRAGSVTVNGGSFTGTNDSGSYGLYYNSGTLLTLNGGTYSGDTALYISSGQNLSVTGGTYEGTTYGLYISNGDLTIEGEDTSFSGEYALYGLRYNGFTVYEGTFEGKVHSLVSNSVAGSSELIYGGTFTTSDGEANTDVAQYLGEGVAISSNGVVSAEEEFAVVLGTESGTFGYSDLASAIAGITQDGGEYTLTLYDNVTLASTWTIPTGAEVTLDLNGKSITVDENATATDTSSFPDNVFIFVQGSLTVDDSSETKDGSIVFDDTYFNSKAIRAGGEVVVNAGTISAANGIQIYCPGVDDVSTVTINGGTIKGNNSAILSNGSHVGTGTLTVNDGTITCTDSTAIYLPAPGVTVYIEGGEITGYACGIEIREGTLYISGGTITTTYDHEETDENNTSSSTVQGAALAISTYNTATLTVEITGGTFVAETDGCYAVYEVYEDGDAKDEEYTVSITISDGTFNGSIFSESCTEFISGGTFADETAEDYLAGDLGLVYDDAAKAYVVKGAFYVAALGDDGEYFTSFDEAVAAAEGAELESITIQLVGNVALTEAIEITTSITLDLNGYTISAAESATIGAALVSVAADGNLTIEDTSEAGDGSITFDESYVTISVYGTLNVYSGSIINTSVTALQVEKGGTATIGDKDAFDAADGDDTDLNDLINITGGMNSVELIAGGTLTIYYGTFTCPTETSGVYVISIAYETYADEVDDEATLTIHGGYFTGRSGIGVNGVLYNVTITMDGGTIDVTRLGMYLAGNTTTTISGGSISGTVGIDVRAGELTISGDAEVSGKDTTLSENDYIDGGAAIVVNKYNTDHDMEVSIEGGTLSGYYAYYEHIYDVNSGDDGESQINRTTTSISGGTFDGIVSADDYSGFISGGQFSQELNSTYVAEGYAMGDTLVDGYYQVLNENDFAATIDGVGYGTVNSAIAAAITSGEETTITLTKDVTEDVVVSGGNIILDLNGYTLTNASGATITVQAGAELTIVDSSTDGTGKVDNTANGQAALVNNGTANLNGGTFTRSEEDSSSNTYYVVVNKGTMTIDGATVTSASTYSSNIISEGADTDNKASLTINETTEGTTNVSGGIYAVKNDDFSELVINGGTFTSTGSAVYTTSKATINGGEFSATGTYGYVVWANNDGSSDTADLTITGGTFTGYAGVVAQSGSVTIGTEDTESDEDIVITGTYSSVFVFNGTDVDITAGTYTGMVFAQNADCIEISGGVYDENPNYKYVAVDYHMEAVTDDEGNVTYQIADGGVVAVIGTAGYASFDAAIADASSGDTIVLISDVTIETELTIDKDIVIVLDGYSITFTDDGSLTTSAEVTFEVTESEVLALADAETANFIIFEGEDAWTVTAGTVTIEAGVTVKSTGYTDTITVTGGTLDVYGTVKNAYEDSGYVYAILASGTSSEVNVYDGAVLDSVDFVAELELGASMTVYGGTLTGVNGGIFIIYSKTETGTADDATSFTMEGGSIEAAVGIQGNGSDKGYTTITIEGGSITADEETGEGMYMPQGNSTITISGGSISGATGIEIRDGSLTISGTAEIIATGTFSEEANSNGSTIVGAAVAISSYNLGDISVTISGGTISATGTNGYAVYEKYENGDEDTVVGSETLTITDGTFSGTVYSAGLTGFISGGTYSENVNYEYLDADSHMEAVTDDEGNVTGYKVESGGVVAIIGTDGYASINDAIAAAVAEEEGEVTITLVADVDGEAVVVPEGAVIILDLAGYSITGTDTASAITVAGTLTIKDSSDGAEGSVTSDNNAAITVSDGGELTVEAGTYTGCRAIYSADTLETKITINGGTFSTNTATYSTIYTDGTITINGGTITNSVGGSAVMLLENSTATIGSAEDNAENDITISSAVYGLEICNGASVTINGGTITGSGAYGIVVDGLLTDTTNPVLLTITGGTISGTETGIFLSGYGTYTISGGTISGKTGVELRAGSLTISGDDTKISGTAESFSAEANSAGNTVLGAAVAVSQHTTNLATSLTVSGGTLEGYYAVYEADLQDDSTDNIFMSLENGTYKGLVQSADVTEFVSGGSYSSNLDYRYLTDGYTTEYSSETGMYGIVEGTIVAIAEDENGLEIGYTSLSDAIAAASEGATITLVANVTEDVVVTADANVTIDLGEYSITNVSGNTITVEAGATLTITGSGTVDNTSDKKAAVANYGTVTLNGGTYTRSDEDSTANSNTYYVIYNAGKMEINEGVEVESTSTYSSAVITDGTDASLTINGGTFSGGIYTIKNDDSTLTITGGDFTNSTSGGVVIMAGGDTTISGGTFTWDGTESGAGYGYAAYVQQLGSSDAELTISGGTFSGYGAIVAEDGTVTIGTEDTEDDDAITIKGSYASVFVYNTADNVTITAGTISGTVIAKDADDIEISGGKYDSSVSEDYLAEGYVINGKAGEDGYFSVESLSDAKVIIEDTVDGYMYGYDSFDEAMGALSDLPSQTLTITLNQDEETAGFTVAADYDITFILNGYTLKVTGEGAVYYAVIINGTAAFYDSADDIATVSLIALADVDNGSGSTVSFTGTAGLEVYFNAELTIGSNVTFETSTAANLIVNAGTLAVSGTVSGDAEGGYGIFAAYGEVTVEDGATVSGAEYAIYETAQEGDVTVTIEDGATVTSDDGYGIAVMSFSNASYKATLEVKGGTITAGLFAITTFGDGVGSTEITISGGTITSENATAIYLPDANQTVSITGGTISGAESGIEIRGGNVTIGTAGETTSTLTVESTASELATEANGSGSTVTGAAIAIVPYASGDIEVTVESGTFTGVAAVYEANVNGYADGAYADVELSITGGTFNGTVSAEDVTEYISGGSFTDLADYTAYEDGMIPTDVSDGYYGVGEGVFIIDPAGSEEERTKVYNGEQQTFELEASAESYTIYGTASGTDVGEYYVTAIANEGYVIVEDGQIVFGTVTIVYTITPATTAISGTIEITGWTYGETASEPTGATAVFVESDTTFTGDIVYKYAKADVDEDGNITEAADAEYTATVPTEAGAYTVKAFIEDTNNYIGSVSESYATFTIEKSDANKVMIVIQGWTYGSYDSSVNAPQWIALNGTDDDVTITYYTDAACTTEALDAETTLADLGAGTYYAKIEIAELADYNSTSAVCAFTIAKAVMSVTAEDITAEYGDTYETDNISVTLVDGSDDYTISYTYNGETYDPTDEDSAFTVAGMYVVRFTVTADNHEDYNGMYVVTITLKEVEAPTINSATQTYTGEAILFVTNDEDGEAFTDNAGYTVTNGSATAAGTYLVTVSLNEGYCWTDGSTTDKTALVTIAKATIAVEIVDTNMSGEADGTTEYYGTVTAETVGDNTATITYIYNGKEYDAESVPTFTEAGTYPVYFTVTADNHEDYSGSFVVTVTEAEVTLTEVDIPDITTSATYTGSEITFVADASNNEYTVTNGSKTAAGTYLVTITLADGYCWTDGSTDAITEICAIEKADFTVRASGATGTADGETTFSGTVTVTVKNSSTDTYTVTYYCDGDEDYGTTVPEFTTAGTYTVYFTVSGTNYNTYNGSYTVSIVEAAAAVTQIAKPAEDTNTYVYDGTAQTYQVASSDGYTVSGNVQTNAGTYAVTVTLNDGYAWNDGSTTELVFIFTIEKADLTVVANDISAKVEDGPVDTADISVTTADNNATTATITYTYGGETSADAPEFSEIGTYTVSFTVTADNHNTYTGSYTVTIVEAYVVVTDTDDNAYGYDTIEAALDSLTDAGEYTITLHADAEIENFDVASGYDITFVLNGYTLTVTGSSHAYAVIVYGTASLVDNANGTSVVSFTGTCQQGIGIAGSLTIGAGVTVTTETIDFLIDNEATLVVNGTIENSKAVASSEGNSVIAIFASSGSTTVNSGAYVYGTDYAIYESAQFGSTEVTVSGGEISGTYGIAVMSTDNAGYTATLTVSGGTITGTYAGVSTYGVTVGNTYVNISGGTITATDGTAVYLPDTNQTVSITGGTISGTESGIEIRGGEVTISQAEGSTLTVESTYSGEEVSVGSGSGSVVSGAAIAITPYAGFDTTVTVSGGSFSGIAAVYEANATGTTLRGDLEISITDGTFNGSVSAEDAEGFITGGTYTGTVQESAIASGYTIGEDGTVIGSIKVGDNYYTSLSEAVDEASSSDTIVLLGDIELSAYVKIQTEVTIDLNGYTISSPTYALVVDSANGKLTINDSSANETGAVISTGSGSYRPISVQNNAEVIINGGSYSGPLAVVVADGSSATINGGSFTTTDGSIYSVIQTAGTLEITGGTFESTSNFIILAQSGSEVEISGGEFSTTTGTAVILASGSDVKISGGEFSNDYSEAEEDADKYALIQSQGTLEITGGTFTSDSTGIIVLLDGSVTTIGTEAGSAEDVTISTAALNAIELYVGAKLSVYSGTIETTSETSGSAAIAVLNGESDNSAEITIAGGVLTGGSYGLAVIGTITDSGKVSVAVTGGTVSGTGTGMYLAGVGEYAISGGEISGAVGVEIRAGSLTVTGGTISGDTETFTLNTDDEGNTGNGSGTTVESGAGIAIVQHTTKKDITVSISGGEITGYYAVYEADLQGNSTEDSTIENIKIEITDGTFSGLVSAEDATGYISGGSYTDLADTDAYADGYVPSDAVNGYYGVTSGTFVEIVAADEAVTFTYDGTAKTFELTEAETGTYSVGGDATATDAGEYEVTITASENYVLVKDGEVILGSVTLTYTIAQADNSITGTVEITGWTYGEYDADANAPAGDAEAEYGEIVYMYSADGETYTTAVPVDAGRYYVKAVVEETANYAGAESDAVEFTISKSDADAILIVMQGWTYGEYDAEVNTPHWIANTGSEGTQTVAYYKDADCTEEVAEADLATAGAGTYYVQVEITGLANYTDRTETIAFTIARATMSVTIADITAEAGDEYTTDITVTLAGTVTDYTIIYTCNGTEYDAAPVFTDAGTYLVHYTVTADNHNDFTGEYLVVITEAVTEPEEPEEPAEPTSVDKPVIDTTYTYTGEAFTFAKDSEGEYTVTGATGTAAGTYLVTFSLADDCVWADGSTSDYVVLVTIEKAALEVTVEVNSGVADGETEYGITVDVETQGDAVATITYTYEEDGSIKTSDAAPSFTEAGTYLVYVTVTAENHNDFNRGYLVTVTEAVTEPTEPEEPEEPVKVEAPKAGSTTVEYTGSEITFIENYDEDNITISGNTGTKPGTYEVVISLKDPSGTVWTDGTTVDIRITFTIVVKVVAPAADDTTFTYTGSAQTYAIAESDLYTVTGNVQTNAGTYTVTVSLTDPLYTCWADDGTTAARTYTFTIAQASNSVTTPTVTDGVPSGATADFGTVAYQIYSDEACTTLAVPTEAGTYYVRAEVAETSNYAGAVSSAVKFTIDATTVPGGEDSQGQSQSNGGDASDANQAVADAQTEATVSNSIGLTSMSILLIGAVVVLVLVIRSGKKSKK